MPKQCVLAPPIFPLMKRMVDAKTMCFGATNLAYGILHIANRKRKMEKIKLTKKISKVVIFYCHLLFAICYLLNGCVSVPTKVALPTYNINGVTYLALVSLCNSRNINLEYDTFTRTAVLTKDLHKINLMVGETLVLVDGKPQHLKHIVDIYQGTVIVPYKFKEQVLDTLFKEAYPRRLTRLPLKIKKVVIDAGHGGNDPGAIGKSGLREKDVTLDMAKRLRRLLESDGIDVIMTRSTDKFIPLSRRIDIANNYRADLFLSIHANANRVRSLRGFEVYYISPDINDSKRALLAAKEASLNFDNNCFAGNSLDLKATLWDMIYTYDRAKAIELARSICRAVDNNLDVKALRIKGAAFYVLKGSRMPAVLVETGFLSNYTEERMLRNSYYRQKIAEGITEGILDYAQGLALTEARQ